MMPLQHDVLMSCLQQFLMNVILKKKKKHSKTLQ